MKRILSILLCAIFVLSLAVPTSAADTNGSGTEGADRIEVWVWTRDIKQGTSLSKNDIEKVSIPAENAPSNVVTDAEELISHYAKRALYSGEYASPDQVSDTTVKKTNPDILVKQIDKSKSDYLFVTDYVLPSTGDDLTAYLQNIIDKNPNRTIYFPDGEYIISSPLYTAVDADYSVSIQLSDGAVIKAASNWRSREGEGMICLGAKAQKNDVENVGHYYSFTGGTLDGSGRAEGIVVKSGRETLIRNVCIKNVIKGIVIDYGVNNGSSDMDFEDITIIGNGMPGTVGIYNDGYDNTYTNIRIYDMASGFINERGGEIANIYVTFTEKSSRLKQTKLGIDTGGRISNCVVVDADKGFKMRNTVIAFDCTAVWTTDISKNQVGFDVGESSMLSGCKAYFHKGDGIKTNFSTTFATSTTPIKEACFEK